MGALGHRDTPTHTPAYTLSLPSPRLHWGLRIERPRLTVTLGDLHPSPPLPPGPQESDATRSRVRKCGPLRHPDSHARVGGHEKPIRHRFGGARRVRGELVGCGAGPASRGLAAAPGTASRQLAAALAGNVCATPVSLTGCPGGPRCPPVVVSLGHERGWQAGGWLQFACPGKGSSRVEGSRDSGIQARLSSAFDDLGARHPPARVTA